MKRGVRPLHSALLCCFVLFAGPSPVLSIRYTANVKESMGTQTESAVEPITLFVASSISAVGSFYSLWKTKRLLRVEAEQTEAATKLAASYAEEAMSGCTVLNDVSVMISNKQQGLARLIRDEANGRQNAQIKAMCAGMEDSLDVTNGAAAAIESSRMSKLEENIRKHLRSSCDKLQSWVGSPMPVKDLGANTNATLHGTVARCLKVAETPHNVVQKICAITGADLAKEAWRMDIARARLDGLIGGLCDGLPKFHRSVPSFNRFTAEPRVAEPESLLQRQSVEDKVAFLPETLDAVSLFFSVVGSMDFAFDMYDTVVALNSGYSLLTDLTQRTLSRQQKLLQHTLELYWLDVAWMRAVLRATMDARYEAAGIAAPEISYRGEADALPRIWERRLEGLKQGTHWLCNPTDKCLVPMAQVRGSSSKAGDSYPGPNGGDECSTEHGDFRICANKGAADRPAQPFALAPRRCFDISFGGKREDVDLGRNAWILKFAAGQGGRKSTTSSPAVPYDNDKCIETLKPLADLNEMEETLRHALANMLKPREEGVPPP